MADGDKIYLAEDNGPFIRIGDVCYQACGEIEQTDEEVFVNEDGDCVTKFLNCEDCISGENPQGESDCPEIQACPATLNPPF